MYHIQIQRLYGCLIVAFLAKIQNSPFSGRHGYGCFQIVSALIIHGNAVVLIKGEPAVPVGRAQDSYVLRLLGFQVIKLIFRHGNDGSASHEQGDGPQVHGKFDGAAALIGCPCLKIVEGLALRQVYLSGGGALFNHIGHQQGISKHEVHALLVAFYILLECTAHGFHDGQSCLMGPFHQRVEVGT